MNKAQRDFLSNTPLPTGGDLEAAVATVQELAEQLAEATAFTLAIARRMKRGGA